MRQLEALTRVNDADCIKFRPRTKSDTKYIIIQNHTGCSATVYNIDYINRLNLFIKLVFFILGRCLEWFQC